MAQRTTSKATSRRPALSADAGDKGRRSAHPQSRPAKVRQTPAHRPADAKLSWQKRTPVGASPIERTENRSVDREVTDAGVGKSAVMPGIADLTAAIMAKINENVMGCNRVLKACVHFARGAGLALVEARNLVGEDVFDALVEHELPLTLPEAQMLVRYCQDSRVSGADVSPATAVSMARSAALVAMLCNELRDGTPAESPEVPVPVVSPSVAARRSSRRPSRPR